MASSAAPKRLVKEPSGQSELPDAATLGQAVSSSTGEDSARSSSSQPLTERVRTFCRVRPPNVRSLKTSDDSETSSSTLEPTFLTTQGSTDVSGTCISLSHEKGVLKFNRDESESKLFQFDDCLKPEVSQEEVYNIVAKPIVKDVLKGYNGTVFAYGQTGSGKTFTMFGPDQELRPEDEDTVPSLPPKKDASKHKGIVHRALDQIFEEIETLREVFDFSVHLNYVQIYCERILDLLQENITMGELIVRESPERGVFIEGAISPHVTSTQDCERYLELGNRNRKVAATAMNAHSSRSHAAFIIAIEQRPKANANPSAQENKLMAGKLYLVDLAGSERVKKSLVRGSSFTEMKAINLSLSALGNCISALSEKRNHIPFRDSKLTRLLQNSLGGNAKTALVVTVNSDINEASETLSTLQFGQRAMKITVKAKPNIELDYRQLYETLQGKLDKTEDKLHELEINHAQKQAEAESLADKVEVLDRKNGDLQGEIHSLKLALSTITRGEGDSKGGENRKGGGGDGESVGDIDKLRREFLAELESMRKAHEADINKVKTRYDQQIQTLKSAAAEATQEWNNKEYELSSEREGHLATLRQYKEVHTRYMSLQKENTNRIAELLTESSDKDHKIAQLEDQMSKLKHEIGAKQSSINKLEQQLVKEMEDLYNETIDKLLARVSVLEKDHSQPHPQDFADSGELPPSSAGPAANDPMRKPKGVPKIGRVVPGTKVAHNGSRSSSSSITNNHTGNNLIERKEAQIREALAKQKPHLAKLI